jgi:hypothetical protein
LGLAIVAAMEKTGAAVAPLSREELRQDEQLFLTVFLPRVLAALGRRQLVLLLDEFDVVGDQRAPEASEPFFSYLRSALNQVYLIAVVGRRMGDLGDMRNLFHEASSQEIGLLDRDSAVELITKPAGSMLAIPSRLRTRSSGTSMIRLAICAHPCSIVPHGEGPSQDFSPIRPIRTYLAFDENPILEAEGRPATLPINRSAQFSAFIEHSPGGL